MNSGIYCILNKENNKRYIGQTTDLSRRERQHFSRLKKGVHKNKHLQRAYKKYGKEAFSFFVVMLCKKKHLTKWEQFFVDLYPKKDLYNIAIECVTGTLGTTLSDDVRLKMSKAHMGHTHSEATKRKIAKSKIGKKNPNYGKVTPQSVRDKISKANSGVNAYWYGKTHSDETKQKISKSRTGKMHTEEAKQKMSMSRRGEKNHNYGKHLNEETKQKISDALSGRKYSKERKATISLAVRGEGNPNSKLTKEQVIQILNLYYIHDLSRAKILDRYNVSKATINGIIVGRHWKHVYKAYFDKPLSRGYLTPPSGA